MEVALRFCVQAATCHNLLRALLHALLVAAAFCNLLPKDRQWPTCLQRDARRHQQRWAMCSHMEMDSGFRQQSTVPQRQAHTGPPGPRGTEIWLEPTWPRHKSITLIPCGNCTNNSMRQQGQRRPAAAAMLYNKLWTPAAAVHTLLQKRSRPLPASPPPTPAALHNLPSKWTS